MHSAILSGQLPPRLTVSVAVETGIADRIVGIMSQFYYSLISNRALQIQRTGNLPMLEAAFDYANVNWTSPFYPAELYEHVRVHHQGQRIPPPTVNTSMYSHVYHVNVDPVDFFVKSNLSNLPSGYDTPFVFFASNRGKVYRLFQNPFHLKHLHAIGLTPPTAFACAFTYLFKPNAAVMSIARPLIDQLMDSDVLKIGIQVRTGDHMITSNSSVDIARFSAFFSCAAEIEKTRKTHENQRVIWYVISDSLTFRAAVKAQYGAKVLTDVTTQPRHSDCGGIHHAECHQSVLNDTIQHAVAEITTFAFTDVQIVSRYSGFGKVGALLSNRWNSIYTINSAHGRALENRPCGLFDYDLFESFVDVWSGI